MRRKKKKKKERKKMTKSDFFGSLFLSSGVLKGIFASIFFELPRQYHSLCMLGLGFAASLVIIWVIHNYGKFKISIAIPK